MQFELQAAQSFSVTCTYTCCGGHKLYSESASDGLEVWLLCDKAMPTFAMRLVAGVAGVAIVVCVASAASVACKVGVVQCGWMVE